MDHPLRPLATQWLEKIAAAWRYKKEEFQDNADLALSFFNGPYDWLYGSAAAGRNKFFTFKGDVEDLPRPSFCMTVNRVAEMVDLFGPALYHRNPVRQVNPRKVPTLPPELFGNPGDPQAMLLFQQMDMAAEQQRLRDTSRAVLMEHYLNYTPHALDLKTESRWAIVEALVKGLGTLWIETYTPPGSSKKMIGSFYDTVDNLVIDPDMETLRDAKWIARKKTLPYWEAEDKYGLPRDTLRRAASMESLGRQSDLKTEGVTGAQARKQGYTNDLVVIWEVYSKMGAGGYLTGISPDLRQALAQFGPYCYLCLCDGVPYPLNLPPEVLQPLIGEDPALAQQAQQDIRQRLEWPTPFWANDSWPFVPIYFHPVPRKVWPYSHVTPAMGELMFLNWAYSFLASKVKIASRDFIALAKSSAEEVKKRITTGQDYTVIEVEALHGSIDNVVKFLQHPGFHPDLYKVIEGISQNFDKRTGLSELMYGLSATQPRSATEMDIKSDQITIRPDDMANKVEESMSALAALELFAARWHLTGQDVAGPLGDVGAWWWDQLVVPSNPEEILHGLECRVEAGSARKPNRAREAANMAQAMQQLFAPLLAYGQTTGDVAPVNALISAWAKSIELDAGKFLLRPPPPPMPPGPGMPPMGLPPMASGMPPLGGMAA